MYSDFIPNDQIRNNSQIAPQNNRPNKGVDSLDAFQAQYPNNRSIDFGAVIYTYNFLLI